jgi:REP element-mobilizing transposase RayT
MIRLDYGNYYHVYNRGCNGENLFLEENDYNHFLEYYFVFVNPVADTYAWCLLKNHFHFLVRIKRMDEIGFLNSKNARSKNIYLKWKTYFPTKPDKYLIKKPKPTEQFKHLFNGYSHWFNNRHQRAGQLFEKNFQRKFVSNRKYFTNLILYIHQNPVKHGFVENILDYPWSSYMIISSDKASYLKKQEVIHFFGGIRNFKSLHDKPSNDSDISHLIIE